MDLDKLMTIPFTWDNRESILACLSKETNVKFAIFCVESALHIFKKKYPDDERPRLALEATKAYLNSPTEENRLKAYTAAYAAANAASDAASYAYAATYAASAYAADATSTAAYAASTAAYAASAAPLIKEHMLDYLRDLIISSLTEEQKENWLLVASL